MTDDGALNVQNAFFNQARKDRTRVTIHLVNGQRLSGLIKAFDRFALILGSRSGDQIIFKHAISTVSACSRPAEDHAEEAQRGRAAAVAGSPQPVHRGQE